MSINRRQVLRGLGTAIALPYFASLGQLAKAQSARAKRVFFFYVPNGANLHMTNAGEFRLSDVLSPLLSARDYVTVVNGLKLQGASVPRAGDHARAAGAFLTCVQPQHPGPGVARSFDLVLADSIASQSRTFALTLGGEDGGGGDSGYAPAYTGNISWLSANAPNTKETDPNAVFRRLFTSGTNGARLALAQAQDKGKSILDFVRGEAKSLNARLSSGDQAQLEEYLSSIRSMERRLGGLSAPAPLSTAQCQNVETPNPGSNYAGRIEALYDLSFHALACGATNVGSLLLGNEGSNLSYAFAGVPGGHHEISHDGSDDGRQKIDTIVKWHVQKLAAFVERLRTTAEDGGNMLDHTLLVFASGIGDGTRHNHDQLPVMVIGRGGGIKGGRVVDAGGAPLANLYVQIAGLTGAGISSFADSTGALNL